MEWLTLLYPVRLAAFIEILCCAATSPAVTGAGFIPLLYDSWFFAYLLGDRTRAQVLGVAVLSWIILLAETQI